jgi:hypothetical protein
MLVIQMAKELLWSITVDHDLELKLTELQRVYLGSDKYINIGLDAHGK